MRPESTITCCKHFLADERGTSAIEYALLASFIAVVAALGFGLTGASARSLYETVVTCLRSSVANGTC